MILIKKVVPWLKPLLHHRAIRTERDGKGEIKTIPKGRSGKKLVKTGCYRLVGDNHRIAFRSS